MNSGRVPEETLTQQCRCGLAMSGAESVRNFRTTYYGSLGFRENEKSISQLENHLKAEIIGIHSILALIIWSIL